MASTPRIHPTAVIDPSAQLAPSVEVGAYSVIGAHVEIDEGTWIGPHVVINGPTKIGKENKIYQFASVGEACQDKKYRDEPTTLIIGDRNVIRESATLHRGTVQDQSETVVGSDNLLMAYVHVAHDCVVGDHVILANNATLAGHVHVGDGVILGGFTGVHQFCQIGAYSMSGLFSAITKDVPAFVMVQGNLAKPYGLNVEGMRRRGSSKTLVALIKQAYRTVYRQNLTLEQAKSELQTMRASLAEPQYQAERSELVSQLDLFIQSIESSKRGVIR